MIAVSVIIPVYNAQKYLEECIESLRRQTLQSCEFIFVNDGSTDESQTILETHQKEDNRIILIQQENQGVSVARNNALKIAKGTYVGFVDADDYVEHNFFDTLYQTAIVNDLDVVVSGFTIETSDLKIKQPCLFETNIIFDAEQIHKELIPYLLKADSLNPVWNKLYKNSLIKKHQFLFPKNIVIGEDGLFNIHYFNQAKKVVFIDDTGYYYREIQNSAVRDVFNKDYFQLAMDQLSYDYKKDFGVRLQQHEIEKSTSIRFINTVISLTNSYYNSKLTTRKKYIKSMMKHQKTQSVLKKYWNELIENKSKYQLFILYCIKVNSFFLLQLAIKYSNYRNK